MAPRPRSHAARLHDHDVTQTIASDGRLESVDLARRHEGRYRRFTVTCSAETTAHGFTIRDLCSWPGTTVTAISAIGVAATAAPGTGAAAGHQDAGHGANHGWCLLTCLSRDFRPCRHATGGRGMGGTKEEP